MKKTNISMMSRVISVLFVYICVLTTPVFAQRKYQSLDRGVVAVNNGSSVLITWRLLAQDPENVRFNIYYKAGGSGQYILLNTEGPSTKTNYSTTTTKLTNNSLICVAPVVNGVEQTKSGDFRFLVRNYRSVYLDINYSNDPLSISEYSTKFIWPADLDGDGEYDFVVDRLSVNGGSHMIEAYLRSGEKLWTVDMGVNVPISEGHNDMVVAYDMDCNGGAEVIIKSSDGTRFWDKSANTWGKYLLHKDNPDSDGDGIVDYGTQNTKNPPQYITVIDGMTGEERSTIEMTYPSDAVHTYTRNNKSAYMGGDNNYYQLNGHMGVAYQDGIHPSVVMEYFVRTADGYHFYYVSAWGYRFENGRAGQWEEKYTWHRNYQDCAEFHHIRIGDVDFDGRDEMLEGGYTLDDDGKVLFSAHISHGDRFRVGDINPDRPGLETFAIQQNASDMLGMILYDAGNGKPLKKWYLNSVGDVGRGECIDIDKTHKGYEMWSTMANIYDAKGDVVYQGSAVFPREGMWWDGELDREILSAPDGNGANAMICKIVNYTTQNRLIEMAKMLNWTVRAEYGCRPAFFGDIIGDWREEILLEKVVIENEVETYPGFYGFTTDYASNTRLYCLMENASYRMQTTTRGYYQSAYPDYYLGYDMSYPPLPPFMKTDLVWKSGTEWTLASSSFSDYGDSSRMAFKQGNTVMFDLSGEASQEIQINDSVSPSTLYVMTPIGHDYTLSAGTGGLSGNTELWKSQNGVMTLKGHHTYSGKTVVSEGLLVVNGCLEGPVEIRPKGTLAGNATLNGSLTCFPGLNKEGGRLSPGTESNPYGKIIINSDLSLEGGVYLSLNLQTQGAISTDTLLRIDTLQVNGNLSLSGINFINLQVEEEKPLAGRYPILSWTGTLTGGIQHLSILGLTGMLSELSIEDKTLYLIIHGQRAPKANVLWEGNASNQWNFSDNNFSVEGQAATFVNGDEVIFDDRASQRSIVLADYLEPGSIQVNNESGTFSFSGTEGGLSGSTSLTKTGEGTLRLLSKKSNYTGATIVNGGTLEVVELADAGTPSSVGAASSAIVLNDCTFKINHSNTSTNRGLSLSDTVLVEVISAGSASIKGAVSGNGMLVKTGAGQLNLSGNNSYKGGTLVKAGTLAMGTYTSSFGILGGKLELQGTSSVSIFNNNSTSAVPNFNYAVVVPEGSNVRLYAGQRCQLNGTLKGSGTINLNVPYVRADLSGNWSAFEGTLRVTGQQFRLCNNNGFPKASLVLGDGVSMGHYASGKASELSGGNSKIGSLEGVSTSNIYSGTYHVGYNNKDAVFNGVINAGVVINKYGTGTWRLTNANLCTSVFTIYAGTVFAANNTGSATGSGTVLVKSGGTLTGTGLIAGGVSVESGGVLSGTLSVGGSTIMKKGALLQVASSGVSKSMTFEKNLTMQSGSLWKTRVFSASCDRITVKGIFSPGGYLQVEKGNTLDVSDGTELQLFVAGSIAPSAAFDSISLPELSQGMYWDTSLLYLEGKIVARVGDALPFIDEDKLEVYVDNECLYMSIGQIMGESTVRIVDAAARSIYRGKVSSMQKLSLDISTWSSGTYLVVFEQNGLTVSKKISKQ